MIDVAVLLRTNERTKNVSPLSPAEFHSELVFVCRTDVSRFDISNGCRNVIQPEINDSCERIWLPANLVADVALAVVAAAQRSAGSHHNLNEFVILTP